MVNVYYSFHFLQVCLHQGSLISIITRLWAGWLGFDY